VLSGYQVVKYWQWQTGEMRVDVLNSYDGSAESGNCPTRQEKTEFCSEEMQSAELGAVIGGA
jgi:hypothetical protein